jgi:hypothetical protein
VRPAQGSPSGAPGRAILRPIQRIVLLFLTFLVLGLAACGSPAPSPDAGPALDADTTVMDLAGYCAGQVEALCLGTEVCACPGADDEACRASQQRACEAALAPLVGTVVLGRVDFDSALGRACVEDSRAFAERCEPFTGANGPRSCLGAFVDRAAIGETCARYSAGLFCAGRTGVCGAAADGLGCSALPGEGMPCVVGRCEDGLVCDGTSCVTPGAEGSRCASAAGCADGLVCAPSGTCGAPGVVGASCTGSATCEAGLACVGGACAEGPAPCAACDSTDPNSCAAGDICLGGEAPSTCAPRAGEGEGCPRFDDCAEGLVCDFAGARPICRATPAIGMACVAGVCAAGAGCGTDGVCAALPGEGELCLLGGATACAEGLGCDPVSGRCAAAGTEGMPCVGGACGPGLVCNFGFPALCVVPAAEGAPCMADAACRAGLHCDFGSGSCAGPVDDGAPCTSDAACRTGSGCVFDGTTNVCEPLPASNGAACEERCGGGLRCTLPPGVCAAGACDLVR